MPLIPTVGRRSLKVRLLVWCIYLTLAVLGVGMVYPFLITLTASVSGPLDYDRFAPVPRSMWSREERFVAGLPHYFPDSMRNGMLMFSLSFDDVPDTWTTWKSVGDDEAAMGKFARSYLNVASEPSRYALAKKQAADFDEFASTYPFSDSICTFDEQVIGPFFRDCYRAMAERQGGDGGVDERALKLMGRDWGIPLETFYAFRADREFQAPWDMTNYVPPADGRAKSFEWLWRAYRGRAFQPSAVKAKCSLPAYPSAAAFVQPDAGVAKDGPARKAWAEYTGGIAPMCETRPYPMRIAWLRYLGSDDVRVKLGVGGGGPLTVAEFNKAFGKAYRRLRSTPFPVDASARGSANLRECWIDFARSQYPRRMIEIRPTPKLETAYRTFVEKRVKGDLARLNAADQSHWKSWSEIKLTARVPLNGESDPSLWMEFVGTLPYESLILHSAEADYQRFLLARYGDLGAINEAYGWSLKDIREAEMPVDAAYLVTFIENERPLYVSGLTRNYRFVLDYLFNRESAVRNTAILILLSLLAVLTVNPLAAYALSRYQLRQTAAVILFLLATMAFPVAVSMIPGFLLMRDLHLLNTYAALILPGLANGYSIFLLKGFFDSLPIELYEAATLDGAREWQMFMRITRPLSTPILAVIALNCFMATYAAWEWALVVCQKPSMWTVSVWLYKFTVDWAAQPWLVMASFVIASIPVFLVFLLCQNVILRGIILPQMK
jgi:ABC-type glycerol-3-phosphate transport system permease component